MPASAINTPVKVSPASAIQVGPNFHTTATNSKPVSNSTNGYCAEIFALQ